MISPFTKPGTQVICIDNDPKAYDYRGNILYDMGGLTEKSIYTVVKIEPVYFSKSGFIVFLQELSKTRGYDIGRFEYLSAPDCFNEILKKASHPKSKKILEEV